jgi:hypothetical protein
MRSEAELNLILKELHDLFNTKNLTAQESITLFSTLGATAIDIGCKVIPGWSAEQVAEDIKRHSLKIYRANMVSCSISAKD